MFSQTISNVLFPFIQPVRGMKISIGIWKLNIRPL